MARAKQHVGLGKGLGDLFARTDEPETQSKPAAPSERLRDAPTLWSCRWSRSYPTPRQPRHVFDEDDLNELAASIKEFGVLQRRGA